VGFSIILIAVIGKDKSEIHDIYGVRETGESEEIAESPVNGLSLTDKRYIVWLNDGMIPTDSVLSLLSMSGSAVICHVNETVMYSASEYWEKGMKLWSVTHNSSNGIDDLQVTGKEPLGFRNMCESVKEKQNGQSDVDYFFDVPVNLFVNNGGIPYDTDAGENAWEILTRINTGVPLRKWWKFKIF
jgi:hypothetical protein